jgi:ABC-type transport system involved in multi-copper enzyme maturation permease subunit
VLTIAGYGIRESVRRRVFLVVLVLTLGFLALYIAGARVAFRTARDFAGEGIVDSHAFTGATVFGMAMFATLFLGAVLAAFLTIGVVRGDAERGLLQPLVVRPVGRAAVLGARFGAAAAVSAGYVAVVYTIAMAGTAAVGSWWPDSVVGPGLRLAAGVVVISALATAGSVILTATANGIAVFMVYGAGLTAGLLGQIGHALGSQSLQHIANVASWALPFEALFQDGLDATVSNQGGITGVLLRLGPFGGAQHAGALLWPYAAAYVAAVLAGAAWAFRRRDL